MLSRASRYKFQNGSGLCIKTTADKSTKHISDMTFREKREHIIDKVFVDPKNKPKPRGAQVPQEEQDEQKKLFVKKSEVMDLVLKLYKVI